MAQVKLVLDDASDLRAEIVRTGILDNDHFVAFLPRGRRVIAVVGLDEENSVLGQQKFESSHFGRES